MCKNPVGMKLSNQARKDLEKYTKFLALKSAQIIIQSRIGEKIHTPCKPQIKGTDWFNLNIIDSPDVLNETKKVFSSELILQNVPLCVEISLRTSEGDQMVLETWSLSLLPENCDSNIFPTLYNRLAILLKSLVSVTRVTPAYKLSRRQSPDSYVICYRIYMKEPHAEPQAQCLGEGAKQVRIGLICTPMGTIQLSVAYRTKMTISPTQSGKNNSMMVKSDHFNSNPNLRRQRNSEDISDLTKPMRPGPFASEPSQKLDVEPLSPAVARLLSLGKYKIKPVIQPLSTTIENDTVTKSDSKSDTNSDETNNSNNSETLTIPINDNKNSSIDKHHQQMTESKLLTNPNLFKSIEKEFWMKELNAPFASRGPVGDLMVFYKDFQKSPALQAQMPHQTPTEINSLLDMYESQVPEYDAVVESFCQSPDNSS